MIKSITVSLYDFYKSPIFSPNHPFDPNLLKCKNDLLQLLQTLSKFNIDNCLDLFIARINVRDTCTFRAKSRSKEFPACGFATLSFLETLTQYPSLIRSSLLCKSLIYNSSKTRKYASPFAKSFNRSASN